MTGRQASLGLREPLLWCARDGLGTVFLLAGVNFAVPLEPLKAPWKISSRTGPAQEVVHLQFTPLGSREDHTHVLSLLVSDFVQPFG